MTSFELVPVKQKKKKKRAKYIPKQPKMPNHAERLQKIAQEKDRLANLSKQRKEGKNFFQRSAIAVADTFQQANLNKQASVERKAIRREQQIENLQQQIRVNQEKVKLKRLQDQLRGQQRTMDPLADIGLPARPTKAVKLEDLY